MLIIRGYIIERGFNEKTQQPEKKKGQLRFEIDFIGDGTPGNVKFFELINLSPREIVIFDKLREIFCQDLQQPFIEIVPEPPICDGKTIIRGHRSVRHEPWTIHSVWNTARDAGGAIAEWVVPPPPEYYEERKKFFESQPKADPDLDRRVREAEAYQRKAVEEIARTGVPSDDPFLPNVKQAREMMVLRAKHQGVEPPVYPELPESSQPVDSSGPPRIVLERRDRRRPQKLE